MPDAPPHFNPGSQLGVLNDHGVEFIVIGGIAARLYGSIRATGDVDICPAGGPENAERLAAALNELGARLYVGEAEPALPMSFTGSFVAGQRILNTMTRFGRLDTVGATHQPERARHSKRMDTTTKCSRRSTRALLVFGIPHRPAANDPNAITRGACGEKSPYRPPC